MQEIKMGDPILDPGGGLMAKNHYDGGCNTSELLVAHTLALKVAPNSSNAFEALPITSNGSELKEN